MIFWILALCLSFTLGALLGRAQKGDKRAEAEKKCAKRETIRVRNEMSDFLNYDGSER